MGFIPALVGAVGTGLASAFGAREQQQASRSMAREQMAFQERMSSTAHQREVQDLIKAGLNPMLSVNAGESTPAGAMGEAQNVVGAGVSSAMDARRLGLTAAQTGAQVGVATSQIDLNSALAAKARQETKFPGAPGSMVRTVEGLYDQAKDAIRRGVSYLNTFYPARGMKVRGGVSSARDVQRRPRFNPFPGIMRPYTQAELDSLRERRP